MAVAVIFLSKRITKLKKREREKVTSNVTRIQFDRVFTYIKTKTG